MLGRYSNHRALADKSPTHKIGVAGIRTHDKNEVFDVLAYVAWRCSQESAHFTKLGTTGLNVAKNILFKFQADWATLRRDLGREVDGP